MEWVETTAKSMEEAKELALDRLGVAADEAEFEILEEPRAGLFGRMRGEARVRARVMLTAVRPKQERRSRGRAQRDGRPKSGQGRGRVKDRATDPSDGTTDESTDESTDETRESEVSGASEERGRAHATSTRERKASARSGRPRHDQQKEQQVNTQDEDRAPVSPTEVAQAAKEFMSGLAAAFGTTADTAVQIDGSDIEVRVTGSELGLMVGHGGRTLLAVQDLARVASQRRLGDHDTRLRIDVAGYREKRGEALGRFAVAVAKEVVESGTPKALEPMQSADRKIVHDALAAVEGVTSRSEGDDPMRRVIITPG